MNDKDGSLLNTSGLAEPAMKFCLDIPDKLLCTVCEAVNASSAGRPTLHVWALVVAAVATGLAVIG